MMPSRSPSPPEVRPGVTCDRFLGGRLSLLQPEDGPRAAIDAVLLSAAIPGEAGTHCSLLDAGAGTGIVGLAYAERNRDARVTGVEQQPALVELARESARLNGLADRVQFRIADLTRRAGELTDLGLGPESFDHVAANPPYYVAGQARAPRNAAAQKAHLAESGVLQQWLRFLVSMARPGGSLTLIHRADALPELLSAAQGRFGALRVTPLFPRVAEPASRIILRGRKGSRAPLSIEPGLVLHEASGGYTAEADAVLRGEALLP